jgi:drug/metabolite transporter (DMT)-like permease
VAASLAFSIFAAPFAWAPLAHPVDGFLIGLLGVASLAAIIGVNRSLAIAPASIVVPYQYTMLLWAVLFGFLVFGNVPRTGTLIGAAIIIAAGLFIYFRERKMGKTIEPEMPPER